MQGKLYIVATPIGNLEDITLRALRILKECSLIAAEDTRVTRKLLSHYDIHTPMTAYHQHSKGRRAAEIVEHILEGNDVALVSDAGTPGISDPGHELIELCIERGISVECAPGPTAFVAALAASGISTARFAFEGFPPRSEKARDAYFRALSKDARTLIFYESPLRLKASLASILKCIGNRRIAVCRELTKVFEEIFRGTVEEAIEHFGQGKIKGEIAIVLEGYKANSDAQDLDLIDIRFQAQKLLEEKLSDRDIAKVLAAQYGISKKQAYAIALNAKEARET